MGRGEGLRILTVYKKNHEPSMTGRSTMSGERRGSGVDPGREVVQREDVLDVDLVIVLGAMAH